MRPAPLLAIALIILGIAYAQALADGGEEDKPFAEARIVLQMADGDEESQARVLDVANNLIKHYGGPDFVDIEIVAYGPGLSLLFPGNASQERISSLLTSEVRFVGCMNTVESIERATGKRPDLIPEAVRVQTGVARLVERAQQGFVVIRP
jgi:intracellular sulfur oxidation DsrE/DsrF family protein